MIRSILLNTPCLIRICFLVRRFVRFSTILGPFAPVCPTVTSRLIAQKIVNLRNYMRSCAHNPQGTSKAVPAFR